jgi:hypothetical protein
MLSGTMSRSEKGRIAPAPRLRGILQTTADRVAELNGVAAQAHWEIGSQTEINGTDFYVGSHELGHIHLNGEAHIPIGVELVNALLKAKLAKRFRWSPVFAEVDAHNVDLTVWIFGLRHSVIHGVAHRDIVTMIADRQR